MKRDPLDIDYTDIAAFCCSWKIAELALFGPALQDNLLPDDDIGFLVSFEPDAPWSLWDLSRMRIELEGLFGCQVRLVEKKALRNPFRRQFILSNQRVIYAAWAGEGACT